MSASTYFILQLLINPVMAASFDVPVVNGDRLIIAGAEAQVELVGVGGAESKVRISGVEKSGSEGLYLVEKRGNVILIKMRDFDSRTTTNSKAENSKAENSKGPLPKIEISGSSLPVEISLQRGQVSAQKWKSALKVSMMRGKISSVAGTDLLSLFLQSGDMSVQDHKGRVIMDGYSGTSSLNNIEGNVDANLFKGQLTADKVKGYLSLRGSNSTSRVNQSHGSLSFDLAKGSLSVIDFQGRIEGQGADASVDIKMAVDSEIDIRSKSGKVNVQTPKNIAVDVNLLAVEGEITAPSPLRVVKLSSERSARGRVGSAAPRGSIFVRSQDGTISVK